MPGGIKGGRGQDAAGDTQSRTSQQQQLTQELLRKTRELHAAIEYGKLCEQRLRQLSPTIPLPVTTAQLERAASAPPPQTTMSAAALQHQLRNETAAREAAEERCTVLERSGKRSAVAAAALRNELRSRDIEQAETTAVAAAAMTHSQADGAQRPNFSEAVADVETSGDRAGGVERSLPAMARPSGGGAPSASRIPSPSASGRSAVSACEAELRRECERLMQVLARQRRDADAQSAAQREEINALRAALEGHARILGMPRGGARILREHSQCGRRLEAVQAELATSEAKEARLAEELRSLRAKLEATEVARSRDLLLVDELSTKVAEVQSRATAAQSAVEAGRATVAEMETEKDQLLDGYLEMKEQLRSRSDELQAAETKAAQTAVVAENLSVANTALSRQVAAARLQAAARGRLCREEEAVESLARQQAGVAAARAQDAEAATASAKAAAMEQQRRSDLLQRELETTRGEADMVNKRAAMLQQVFSCSLADADKCVSQLAETLSMTSAAAAANEAKCSRLTEKLLEASQQLRDARMDAVTAAERLKTAEAASISAGHEAARLRGEWELERKALLEEMHVLRMRGAALQNQQQHAQHAVLHAAHQQRAMMGDLQLSQRHFERREAELDAVAQRLNEERRALADAHCSLEEQLRQQRVQAEREALAAAATAAAAELRKARESARVAHEAARAAEVRRTEDLEKAAAAAAAADGRQREELERAVRVARQAAKAESEAARAAAAAELQAAREHFARETRDAKASARAEVEMKVAAAAEEVHALRAEAAAASVHAERELAAAIEQAAKKQQASEEALRAEAKAALLSREGELQAKVEQAELDRLEAVQELNAAVEALRAEFAALTAGVRAQAAAAAAEAAVQLQAARDDAAKQLEMYERRCADFERRLEAAHMQIAEAKKGKVEGEMSLTAEASMVAAAATEGVAAATAVAEKEAGEARQMAVCALEEQARLAAELSRSRAEQFFVEEAMRSELRAAEQRVAALQQQQVVDSSASARLAALEASISGEVQGSEARCVLHKEHSVEPFSTSHDESAEHAQQMDSLPQSSLPPVQPREELRASSLPRVYPQPSMQRTPQENPQGWQFLPSQSRQQPQGPAFATPHGPQELAQRDEQQHVPLAVQLQQLQRQLQVQQQLLQDAAVTAAFPVLSSISHQHLEPYQPAVQVGTETSQQRSQQEPQRHHERQHRIQHEREHRPGQMAPRLSPPQSMPPTERAQAGACQSCAREEEQRVVALPGYPLPGVLEISSISGGLDELERIQRFNDAQPSVYEAAPRSASTQTPRSMPTSPAVQPSTADIAAIAHELRRTEEALAVLESGRRAAQLACNAAEMRAEATLRALYERESEIARLQEELDAAKAAEREGSSDAEQGRRLVELATRLEAAHAASEEAQGLQQQAEHTSSEALSEAAEASRKAQRAEADCSRHLEARQDAERRLEQEASQRRAAEHGEQAARAEVAVNQRAIERLSAAFERKEAERMQLEGELALAREELVDATAATREQKRRSCELEALVAKLRAELAASSRGRSTRRVQDASGVALAAAASGEQYNEPPSRPDSGASLRHRAAQPQLNAGAPPSAEGEKATAVDPHGRDVDVRSHPATLERSASRLRRPSRSSACVLPGDSPGSDSPPHDLAGLRAFAQQERERFESLAVEHQLRMGALLQQGQSVLAERAAPGHGSAGDFDSSFAAQLSGLQERVSAMRRTFAEERCGALLASPV